MNFKPHGRGDSLPGFDATVNIGAALAQAGNKVLLLDIDPQANLTLHVARRPPLTQLAPQIIENIRRCRAGESLLQEVDKSLGY